MKKSSRIKTPKSQGRKCCCANINQNSSSSELDCSTSSSESWTSESVASSSESDDKSTDDNTSECSTETNDESSDDSISDSDDADKWECTCQTRKRGGKKKAEARALAAIMHNGKKKKSRHGSKFIFIYINKQECDEIYYQ